MLRTALLSALLVLAVLPAMAPAATLDGTRHGPVDFGDRVAYRVTGPGCAKVRVRARVSFGEGTVVKGRRSRPCTRGTWRSARECS